MGIEYTLSGCIPLRDAPDLGDHIGALKKAIDDPGFTASVDRGPSLWIDSYTVSSWTLDRINKELRAFASKWAREPAALDYQCEGDDGEMIVGPEGFDERAYRVKCLDEQIESLQRKRAGILAGGPMQ